MERVWCDDRVSVSTLHESAVQGTQVGGLRLTQGGEQAWPWVSVQVASLYTKPGGG